ncbi:hypothetical protein IP68_04315 [Blastomonas sp. AAP25]|uniref:carotenoid oxygenase family protein n=1 Tax=Blastomonas sp. AAP25 TaxID=1523416 RepID=UPI0006B9BCB8|nr:carotenoid oxygenase family protein [Blastomonas sp. AAP25]KPF76566.1 hypothetical protein IP68_04315 [Blastomonas sp. AAP25]
MEVRFPDLPLYTGWGKPLRTESTVDGLELIEGTVPAELDGTWYRAGPDRQYAPMLGDDIFIDGEGMAHMIRIRDGSVSYRSRWVRNARFNAQAAAGRSLFGKYRNRFTDDPSVEGISGGTANTNVIFHNGRLLVLKEDDLPFEVDPDTLDPMGIYAFDGKVRATSLSAHPKWFPDDGRLLTYSYQAKGDGSNDVVFYDMDDQGNIHDEIWFEMPWASICHDFAVTPHYAIFPFMPLVTTLDNIKRGTTFYEWHPDKQVVVALVKRGGTADDIRWFRGPAGSLSHMMNAFEDGDQVHLDACYYDGNCFPFFPTPEGKHVEGCPPMLSRLTFDLSRNDDGFDRRPLINTPGEMPRADDRYQGQACGKGYLIVGRQPDGSSGIGCVDLATGELTRWAPGALASVHEPQFVPRYKGSAEGDGWLLVIVNRLDAGHSELAILDAQDITRGPVARLHLPVRVRSTFHGTWVDGEKLRAHAPGEMAEAV